MRKHLVVGLIAVSALLIALVPWVLDALGSPALANGWTQEQVEDAMGPLENASGFEDEDAIACLRAELVEGFMPFQAGRLLFNGTDESDQAFETFLKACIQDELG